MKHFYNLVSRWVFSLVIVAVAVTLPASAQDGEAALHAIDMPPFELSILKKGRVRGHATIVLTVEISEDTDFEYVQERLPQIRSDFASALSVLARQRFNINRPIDPDLVASFLQPYADRRLGAGATQVYVRQATIKR